MRSYSVLQVEFRLPVRVVGVALRGRGVDDRRGWAWSGRARRRTSGRTARSSLPSVDSTGSCTGSKQFITCCNSLVVGVRLRSYVQRRLERRDEAVQRRRLGGGGRRLGHAEELLVGLFEAVRRTVADRRVIAALARGEGPAGLVAGLQIVGEAGSRHTVADAEIAEEMIERPVLEHQHDEMVEEQFRHGIPIRRQGGQAEDVTRGAHVPCIVNGFSILPLKIHRLGATFNCCALHGSRQSSFEAEKILEIRVQLSASAYPA